MPSVLIIDDHQDSANLVVALAKMHACTATVALDAMSAMSLLKNRDFDLIVLDYHMPGMDGLQFLERLQRGGLSTTMPQVVVYTADDAVRDAALSMGAAAYFRKSGDTEEIAAFLKKFGGCGE